LISLEELVSQELLSEADLVEMEDLPSGFVDYDAAAGRKMHLLKKAYEAFEKKGGVVGLGEFDRFCRRQSNWLDDFCLFSALKEAHGQVAWTDWEESISRRESEVLDSWREKLEAQVRMRKFWQFMFFRQWLRLKEYCGTLGIRVMGDIPIFVAHDSAEVWANPELFELDDHGQPQNVAGVPPDYFSDSGQLWGNPLYRWERMAEDGYSWWVERFRSALLLFDLIRLDHFRGFEAYWSVPAEEKTAVNGKWITGPGTDLFERVEEVLGELPIIAENLGWITPEVESLRKRFGFPGMAILQFAFGSDPQDSDFIPHNVERDSVFYPGTHDNDTVVGWWNSLGEQGSVRNASQIQAERDLARRYLNSDGQEVHWDFIRAVLASVAGFAIIPMQDLLGLGNEARMNLPGTTAGNWLWRLLPGAATEEIQARLKEMVYLYGRMPDSR
jgi:4-alpha-glucanotransferase